MREKAPHTADARRAVVSALSRLEQENSYSNIVLDHLLQSGGVAERDQAFASRLLYGVIERRLTIDFVLDVCSSVKVKKMHPVVRSILRCGVYQLLYMDKVPPSAAVNESVRLAKVMKQGHAAGFVNAVLRAVGKKGEEILVSLPHDEEGDAIRFACPVTLLRFWKNAYGEAIAQSILEHLNDVPPLSLRVNTLRISPATFAEWLDKQGIAFKKIEELPACFMVEGGNAVKKLAYFAKNCYYHQDAASQISILALDPRPGEKIADVCAAPGGKSFTAAQIMENQGALFSWDIYPAKCEEMERRAAELGITIMSTAPRDASAHCPEPLCGTFDRVICDVPCSGLGVIRRKPEIRYKSLDALHELPELQYRILESSAELVRPGGVLQYSTCTLNPAENEEVVQRFLREHTDFSPRMLPIGFCFKQAGLPQASYITLFPHIHNTDGFFIAGFVKAG